MSWGVSYWGTSAWGGVGADLDVDAALHVGPRVIEVRFNKEVINDALLVDPANWSVVKTAGPGPSPLTVSMIDLPVGAVWPKRVYVVVDETPGDGGTYQVTVVNINSKDGSVLNVNSASVDTAGPITPEDATESKIETQRRRIAAIQTYDVNQPKWKGLIYARGEVDGLIGGSQYVTLLSDVTDAAMQVATVSAVPPLIEVPSGPYDGENRTYRLQHTFDWRRVQLLQAPLDPVEYGDAPAYRDDWYAPGGGYERLVRWITPPDYGKSAVMRYTPMRGLVRIDDEIVAFLTSPVNVDSGLITLVERGRIDTEAAAHTINALVHDVWGASLVNTMRSALSFRTGVDTALSVRAKDFGIERLPEYLSDIDFRRVCLQVGVGPKNTIQVFDLAFKCLYPDLWSHTVIGEDPRWPNAVVVWYHPTLNLRGGATAPDPVPEIWEFWLEEAVPQDGISGVQGYTYLQAGATDNEYTSSYFMAGPSDDGGDPHYPVIVAGDPVYLFGFPQPAPGAYPPDPTYMAMRFKPREMRRILPAGTGILLLQHPGF